MIKKFRAFKFESQEFKKVHPTGKVLCFIVRWIGWDTVNESFRSESNFYFGSFKHFGLTIDGKPIDVDDCCLYLSADEDSRVLLLQDRDDHK